MSSINDMLSGLVNSAQANGLDVNKVIGPVTEMINNNGGLQNVLAQLQNSNIAEAAQSWISTGANKAVSATQITEAMPAAVSDLAAKTGSSVEQISGSLSEMLPQIVDKLTPSGKVPTSVEDLTAALGNIPGFDQVKGKLAGLIGGASSAAAEAAPEAPSA
jgi:uncharacterized protein YidB (DUF937 family)